MIKTRQAIGGSVHPISEAPHEDGLELLLTDGETQPWRVGAWVERGWFERDHQEIRNPTHWSPLPGQTIELK